ncbi:TF_AP-2 domain-containing protein [Meloidogyne graminicola]|uniref:TF_AP-2 domain-containing protein n=1 Tax=Meloidogyne graminicola TaxID=189291 RepID=A0A8T0A5M4_9BILA|nr:TF_AP-2 domain-containing protein [Meloidogyne graminicola]
MDLTINSCTDDSGVVDISFNSEKLSTSANDNAFDDEENVPILKIERPKPLLPIKGYETYCTVPGRLTLLSNQKKYRVSVAEVQRRLSPPECLNASVLGGILRKAKNKDGGKILREQLMSYGVELASGRRRQVPLTCFSSLVEEEVAQIASDFSVINAKHYPLKEVAIYALNAQRQHLYFIWNFTMSVNFLNRILELHRADRTPLADSFLRSDPCMPKLDDKLQQELSNYTLLTHGFGGRMFQAVLETLLSVICETKSTLTRNFQGGGNGAVSVSEFMNGIFPYQVKMDI